MAVAGALPQPLSQHSSSLPPADGGGLPRQRFAPAPASTAGIAAEQPAGKNRFSLRLIERLAPN